MQKKKIWSIVLACFLMAATAAGQGILFAKDEAAGVRSLYPQSLMIRKI